MVMLPGRQCAVCGKPQSQKLGGLAGFAHILQALREVGVKLKQPDGRYAHVPCINKVLRAQAKKEPAA